MAFDHAAIAMGHIFPYEPSCTPAVRLSSGAAGAVNLRGPSGGAAYLTLEKLRY